MIKSAFAIAWLIMVSQSCATLSSVTTDHAKDVELTDKVKSYGCTFLGLVTGTESSPWNDASSITEIAIDHAKESAFEKGATHVVLQGSPQIIYNAEAKAREATVTLNAYKCKK